MLVVGEFRASRAIVVNFFSFLVGEFSTLVVESVEFRERERGDFKWMEMMMEE